jgi:hypothetical protein
MATHLQAAQARHAQALADLQAAEIELLAAMLAIEPSFTGTVAAMADRRWESKLEGVKPFWELAQAHSAHKRAVRQEARARSAAHKASFAPPPPVTPAKRTRKSKVVFGDYMRERLTEGRAAA